MEEVSVENLLYDYVFDGCLKLLFNILLIETVFCKQNGDKKHPFINTILDFVLKVIKEFIEFENNDPRFPFAELESYLSKLSLIKAYIKDKDEIIKITNRLYSIVSEKGKTMMELKQKGQDQE